MIDMDEESDVEETQSLIRDRSSRSYGRRHERNIMENIDYDEVLKEIGGFGKYQKTFYFLLCLPAMFTATITLSNTFTTAEPKTRCDIPSCDDKLMPQYDDAFVGPYHFANYTIPYDSLNKKSKGLVRVLKQLDPDNFLEAHDDTGRQGITDKCSVCVCVKFT